MSAVEGEDREEGVFLSARDGVGVRDARPLGDLELAEATEVFISLLFLQSNVEDC